MSDLEWGLTDEFLQDPILSLPQDGALQLGQVRGRISYITVNGVPLADVLYAASVNLDTLLKFQEETDQNPYSPAVLRALAGRDSDIRDLKAERDRLREALRPFAEWIDHVKDLGSIEPYPSGLQAHPDSLTESGTAWLDVGRFWDARAALEAEE